jgi:hypothetical protein
MSFPICAWSSSNFADALCRLPRQTFGRAVSILWPPQRCSRRRSPSQPSPQSVFRRCLSCVLLKRLCCFRSLCCWRTNFAALLLVIGTLAAGAAGRVFYQIALTATDNDNGFVTMFFLLGRAARIGPYQPRRNPTRYLRGTGLPAPLKAIHPLRAWAGLFWFCARQGPHTIVTPTFSRLAAEMGCHRNSLATNEPAVTEIAPSASRVGRTVTS